MAGFSFCVSSLPWIISLFCGRLFILHFIFALDYFIDLWQVFHSVSHLCPKLFHCFVAGFSFCISSLSWIISLSYGRIFILNFILALDYFIYLWHIFHFVFHPCPGLFHYLMAGFSFCILSLPWIISFIYGIFFIPCLILALDYFIFLWHIFHSLPHPCPG